MNDSKIDALIERALDLKFSADGVAKFTLYDLRAVARAAIEHGRNLAVGDTIVTNYQGAKAEARAALARELLGEDDALGPIDSKKLRLRKLRGRLKGIAEEGR